MTDGYAFETPPPGNDAPGSTGGVPDGGDAGQPSGIAIGAIVAIAVALLVAIVLVWLRCRGGDGDDLLVSGPAHAAQAVLATGGRS